ncbi:dihydrolipoyl dehydrogenase [Sinomicrobium pectinilyticum]|uniref:Dihydrolipoyl dehydrogenase n=1 Tax=Sinomicrobium pectinilyticum TaxID=1084421 RepID=A0A3N0F335_SINP1|nr:dihydrolipoyl dehydrogenase [Sinomicrobium pectinilyticum]RNL94516.1 dihydrolipoyl dehydrogenase [Sinomicrobium pectinilyticum]
MSKRDKKEIVIIGAGPGGYAAAFRAADLGRSVTLIGPEADPGGTCLFYGCIPVKTLLETLQIKEKTAKSETMGLRFEAPGTNLKKIAAWKDKVVKELTEGIGLLSEEREIEYIQGKASFLSANEIEIETGEGKKQVYEFENAIIATGAVPRKHPNAKLDHEKILDSTDALALDGIPERMLIIGGGYIGPEVGSIYATLGSRVSIVESDSRVLSWVDQDLVKEFEKGNEGLFDEYFFKTEVDSVAVKDQKVTVEMKNQEGQWKKEYDLVLVAVGRIPNTTNLNLEKAGVEIDDEGFIKTDGKQKTIRKNIYAIGDVTRQPLFANKAAHEGRLVAEEIAGEDTGRYNPKAIPSVVATTRTEMAWCGLMETEAEEKGIAVKVTRYPWTASGRAASIGITNGLTKLIFDAGNGKILGGGVVGKTTGSLISEIALAIEMGATAGEIALSIHPHPTLSETIMEAAELFSGRATHFKGK